MSHWSLWFVFCLSVGPDLACDPPFLCARTMLVLTLVLRLGELDDKVGHGIPGVVDTDEQQQNGSRGDDEQCWHRIAWDHKCCDEEGGVGDERKDRMPEPVFQHRLILGLTTRPPEHDDDVCHPP